MPTNFSQFLAATTRTFWGFALLLLAVGCTPATPSTATNPSLTSTGGTLLYGQSEDPKTLDPINTDIMEAVHVITNIFDTLVTYDDNLAEIVPSLATRWETTPDGLTWTFHLREGVLFQDGTPCDADAVKFTLDRIQQEDHPQVFDKVRPYKSSYSMIQKIETPDQQTVVFHLSHPSAILLSNLAMFPASIVSPTGVQKYGKDFAEHPVGTGPFEFVKWNRDQRLVLKPFPGHWRGAAKLENLIFVPVKENATRVQRLQRGEIHLAESLTPVELDGFAKNPAITVQAKTAMNVAYLTFQTEKKPLDDPRVRQAIWLAIDKPTLIKVGYSGHAEPAVSMVPPAMWGHHPDLQDRPFDPAAAKQLIATVAAEKGLKLPLPLSLSVMSQARPYLQQPLTVAGFLKDSLREIGIELSIVRRDVNQHFDALMKGEHELGLAGWSSDNADPDNFLYSLLDLDNISEQGNNLSRYRNEKFHELLIAGQREMDSAKRLAQYREAQEIVFNDAPVVPLAHTQMRTAHSSRLSGFELHPTGLVRLRQATLGGKP